MLTFDHSTHTDAADQNVAITQALAELLFVVACSNDMADGRGEVYAGLERALLGAIATTYPDVDPQAVREVNVDCNEDIAYCVSVVRRDMAENARQAAVENATEQVNSAPSNDAARAILKGFPTDILRGVADMVYADMDDEPSRATLTRRIIAAARTGE